VKNTAAVRSGLDSIHLPGEPGVWFFIIGDMLIFGVFFLTFVFYRSRDPVMYDESRMTLNQVMGLANTLVLLSSSWLVAMAVRQAKRGNGVVSPVLLGGALLLGGAFVAIKICEYALKFKAGITVLTNEFFMFYFTFTAIHLVHVLIGLGILIYLFLLSRRPVPATGRDAQTTRIFEGGGAFWHLVDLLWLVLFCLLYLVR
jgi:nitric oxide reductase NorE protein